MWNQEDQWEPLWNDVRNTAEEYLDKLAELGPDKQARAEEVTIRHFMGAVVLQQQPTSTKDLDTRHVIDGQQRLTTMQLLLDAAHEVFEQDDWPQEARQLRKLVVNDEYYVESHPDAQFKVWPTLVDQDAFRHAMTDHLTTETHANAPIVQAHEFFKLQIREWLGEHTEQAASRASALVTALMGLLDVVVIDLQSTDDANVIFETLNARGTPLLDSDLIKNSVLHSASQEGLDSEALYHQYWQPFDQRWWREEIRQGRLTRPRIDVYLNYWLAMRTADEIQSTRFFPRFRRYAEDLPGGTRQVMSDICDISGSFQQLSTVDDWSTAGQFLYRWRIMDAGVTTPIVMWLFSNRTAIGPESFDRALQTVESYLVRRMICRMTTKDYNKQFLDLMRTLNSVGPNQVDDTITDSLASQTADARLWPADAQVREALLTLPLYQLLIRSRLRFLLEAVEDSLRSPLSETDHVARNALTIEHVMPQAWREHWLEGVLDADGNMDVAAAASRDRTIHTVGNLTLVNNKLNPALSNSAWQTKRTVLDDHTTLHMNRELLKMAPDTWDEALIRDRGEKLAARILQAWPRP